MEPLAQGLSGFEYAFDHSRTANLRRVLLVESDPQERELYRRVLSRAGYEVQTAADGPGALALLNYSPPHFLITDWDHPPPDGPRLCHLARIESPASYVYVVLLTARRETRDFVTGLAAGADCYLTKPVSPGALVAQLAAGGRVLEMERRLRLEAGRDPLTGLLNRREFAEIFRKEWSRAERYDYPLTCVMIDLDGFKQINDTYGHPHGDRVLEAVARRLEIACRSSDWICRYGGDEFCVLLPETTAAGAVAWVQRCRATLAQTPTGRDAPAALTGSFGISERLAAGSSPELLLAQADQALLLGKQRGRDRVELAESLAAAPAPATPGPSSGA